MKLHQSHLSPNVVRAVMTEVRQPRNSLHRSHRVTQCDMRLVMPNLGVEAAAHPGVPGVGLLLSGDCVCRDLVADVLYLVTVFVTEHGADMHNLAGAVRIHVRKRVIDVMRAYRAARGAQVKPKRVRQNRFGRALPDEEHRAVLGHLADEAGYSAPLPGHDYLLRRLAERCVAEFGNSVPYYLERLPTMMNTVKQVCSTGAKVNVGTRTAPEYVSWYDAYIDRPLGRRPDTASLSLSQEDGCTRGADQLADPHTDRAFDAVEYAQAIGEDRTSNSADLDAAIIDMVVARVAAAPLTDRMRILRATIRTLVDCDLLSAGRAEALLSDEDRIARVLSQALDIAVRQGRAWL